MTHQLLVPLLIGVIASTTGIARTPSVDLTALAQQRVEEVASTGQMAHRSLSELDNGKWSSWGEVLGWNQFYPDESEAQSAVVAGWMESPTHRAILVNPDYDQVGCAVMQVDESEYFYACIFGNSAEQEQAVTAPGSDRSTPAALPDTAMEAPR